MREILFKAKRWNWKELPEEECWVEGYFLKVSDICYILSIGKVLKDIVEVIPKTVF